MCIALISTQHPRYPLIILNNRDEFLHRATARASWWDTKDTAHIFSGRDLARPERGTWLGVTRQGRLTILTNFRESSSVAAIGARSRGAMVNSFLTAPEPSLRSLKVWVHGLLTADGEEGCKNVGGFSLICGTIRPKYGITRCHERIELQPFAVVSNRTLHKREESEACWIGDSPNQVYALSNGPFEDPNPWPKITLGKDLLTQAVNRAIGEDLCEDEFIESLFGVLSHNTIPSIEGEQTYRIDLESLQHSVFIPAFDYHEADTSKEVTRTGLTHTLSTAASGLKPLMIPPDGVKPIVCAPHTSPLYTSKLQPPSSHMFGTQKQTVILVDRNGKLKYVERTLYNGQAEWVGGVENKDRDVVCEFQIEEGWSH